GAWSGRWGGRWSLGILGMVAYSGSPSRVVSREVSGAAWKLWTNSRAAALSDFTAVPPVPHPAANRNTRDTRAIDRRMASSRLMVCWCNFHGVGPDALPVTVEQL